MFLFDRLFVQFWPISPVWGRLLGSGLDHYYVIYFEERDAEREGNREVFCIVLQRVFPCEGWERLGGKTVGGWMGEGCKEY